jgi:hypothetical protein
MFPTKEELQHKWWHRLAKVLFTLGSVFLVIAAAFLFYGLEADNARQYRIVKNFSNYLQENQQNEIITKYHGQLLAKESFLSEYDLKGFLLGCKQPNGRVAYLSEISFKEEVTCDNQTGVSCFVPRSICNGDASNIVKYDYETRYGFRNYTSILLKTVAVFLVWFSVAYLLYYKAVLYVIFGRKR